MYIKKLGFKKHMARSQAYQTHDENTCQTPLCDSGNPEGKSLKSQRIEKK